LFHFLKYVFKTKVGIYVQASVLNLQKWSFQQNVNTVEKYVLPNAEN